MTPLHILNAGLLLLPLHAFAQAEPLPSGALEVWEFASLASRTGQHDLRREGEIRLDAGWANFDAAGHFEVEQPETLKLPVTGDFTLSARFRLASTADATLFEWSGLDADGKRHFLALELLQPGNMPVPVLGAYLDGALICGSAAGLADGAWHTAVLRAVGGRKQFFLDGVLTEEASGGRGPNFDLVQRFAYKSDQLITRSGLVIGRDLRGRTPFRGRLDHLAVWSRALTAAEIGTVSGTGPVGCTYQRYPGYYE